LRLRALGAVGDGRLAIGAFRSFSSVDAAKVMLFREVGHKRATRARLRAAAHSIAVRPGDSDIVVAAQVFGSRQYELDAARAAGLCRLAELWRSEGHTPVIVDAGANVGCSSLFFADAYPSAEVVALEPDPATFEVLCANVSDQPRIHPENIALWSDDGGVAMMNDGDHQSWSNRVTGDGERRIPSRTLEQVVAGIPNGRLLIAKLDIEGAEREACKVSIDLLRKTPCIAVEPHDWLFPGGGCMSAVLTAVADGGFDVLVSGENIFFVFSNLISSGVLPL